VRTGLFFWFFLFCGGVFFGFSYLGYFVNCRIPFLVSVELGIRALELGR